MAMPGMTQTGPIGIGQTNQTFYVWGQGGVGYTSIQAAVNAAAALYGAGEIIIQHGYGYTESISSITGGNGEILLTDYRDGVDQIYQWNGTNYVPKNFVQLGEITTDSDLTALGTLTAYAANLQNELTANGATFAQSISANDARFATCEVANSPVRTFANTGDPTSGMAYPPIGIGVSTGTAWGASIDPTALARLNVPNTFTGNQTVTGNVVASGSISAGAAVLSGTQLTVATNGITIGQKSGAPFGSTYFEIRNDNSIPASYIDSWGPLYINNSRPGSSVSVNGNLSSNATITGVSVTATGALTGASASLSGALSVAGPINVAPNAITIGQKIGSAFGTYFEIRTDNSIPQSYIDSWGLLSINARNNTATLFASTVRIGNRSPNNQWTTGTANINADNSSIVINPANGVGGVYLAYDQGTGGVKFGNGAGAAVASIDSAGNLKATNSANVVVSSNPNALAIGEDLSVNANAKQFIIGFNATGGTSGRGLTTIQALNNNVGFADITISPNGGLVTIGSSGATTTVKGTFTVVGTKNFQITHPLDDTKNLTHSCLEGPEVGVYYRGEGVTAGGWAEIELPDYFEALTLPTDRSVQLTATFDDESELIGTLAAGRVKDGKFKVWSSLPAQKFYWQVNAVRADVEALVVTTSKPIEPEVVWNDSTDTDRDGASEDGEPKPKKVRA